jgi:hypothetical protein
VGYGGEAGRRILPRDEPDGEHGEGVMIAPHRTLDERSLVHHGPSVTARPRVALSMVCRAESRKGSRLGQEWAATFAEPSDRSAAPVVQREKVRCVIPLGAPSDVTR